MFAVGLGAAISIVSVAQQPMNVGGIFGLDIVEAFYGGDNGDVIIAHSSPR